MYPILDTRVECKGKIRIFNIYIPSIRIEPDWACGLREIQRENPDK